MNTHVNLEKEFVPFTESLELKQLGFDIPSVSGFSYPDSDNLLTNAILWQQAFRWFREKHQIVCVIDFYNDGDLWEDTMYTVTISEFKHFKSHDSFVQFEYKTYEEAELACLRKLIEIVKNK